MTKNQAFLPILEDIKHSDKQFAMTLCLGNQHFYINRFEFEAYVQRIMHWLNIFCYGKNYRKNGKNLIAIGAIQNGDLYNKLHAHIELAYNNDVKRSPQEINFFIRKKWYALLNASGSVMGNLVYFKETMSNEGYFHYELREVKANNTDRLLFL